MSFSNIVVHIMFKSKVEFVRLENESKFNIQSKIYFKDQWFLVTFWIRKTIC